MMNDGLEKKVVEKLLEQKKTVTTAESCTGGRIAALITAVAGASGCYNEGYITYAVASKEKLLNVPHEVIEQYGVVSEECAAVMAKGALLAADADFALSSTGIAGPGGADEEHPVGLVCFGCAVRPNEGEVTDVITTHHVFSGDRNEVQRQAAEFAIEMLSVVL